MFGLSSKAGCHFKSRKARGKTKDDRKSHFSHIVVILTGFHTGLSTKLEENFIKLSTETRNYLLDNLYLGFGTYPPGKSRVRLSSFSNFV